MAHVNFKFSSTKPLNLGNARGDTVLRRISNRLMGIHAGADKAVDWCVTSDEGTSALSHAAAVCKMATSSGSVGVVINGTTVTVTWATSDTNSQSLLVTAINANSTVKALGISASKRVGVLTLSSLSSGAIINVCGRRFTAGTDFSVAGSDNADAVAFAAVINNTSELAEKLVAVPDAAAGVLYLALMEDRAARSDEVVLLESGTGLTVTAAIASGACSVVFSRIPGAIANACTLTATGTNVTAHSAASGKLGGGLGGGVPAVGSFITSDMK